MVETFPALFADRAGDRVIVQTREISVDDLMPGEVTVRVEYSSVNYKDGLATTPGGQIVQSYPMVLGIEFAGVVESSADTRFRSGDPVVVAGFGLGQTHYGGYSRYARVPGDWVVPLPQGLTCGDAMLIGVAGFTAGLALDALERNGLNPGRGPVLVTGASGGVGSVAVALLANRGYHVIASSGKSDAVEFLRGLGAQEVIGRDQLTAERSRSLTAQNWAAAIDQVGGRTLENVLKSIRYGGAVALTGLVGGSDLQTTVFPFIIRGVGLLGIDSAFCPMQQRNIIWERFADDWRLTPVQVSAIRHDISLDQLPDALEQILQGNVSGRIVVSLGTV